MGNWFENMEPMNIQEKRANTKRERERADQAEEERDRAEAKLGKTEAERDQAQAQEGLEERVKAMFKLLKKLCTTKEQAVQELIESYDKTEEEAQKLVEQ